MRSSRLGEANGAYLFKSLIILSSIMLVHNMDLFVIKSVEFGGSRLIATSGSNYAMTGPKLAKKNWKTVSVNGDNIFFVMLDGQKRSTTKREVGPADVEFIETVRDELSESKSGYIHVSTSDGSMVTSRGSDGISSGNFGSSGMSSSSYSSVSGGSFMNSRGASNSFDFNGMTVEMRDDDNFSVSKNSMPFGWLRVYFNSDLVTVVHKSGEIKMKPLSAFDSEQQKFLADLKVEAKERQRREKQQFHDTMQHTSDMVSGIFSNIAKNLPKPPSFGPMSSMFGNDFPFGPNNSPFSSSAGWPFAGSFAFSGR